MAAGVSTNPPAERQGTLPDMLGAMTEPFTYLAATQGLDQKPLDYRAGDRFALDYLVLVSPVARTATQLETRYQAWAGQLK